MFVKVQDANDLVNLDRVAEIRMKEEQGEYIIEAIYQDSTHFLLASYKSKTGADFCFESLCSSLKDDEKYFTFWHDRENVEWLN